MKKLILCLMITLLISRVQAQKSDGEPFMVKSFPNEKIQNAAVKTPGESISLSAVTSGSGMVEVCIHANTGNRRERLERNRNWKNSPSTSSRLYVPEEISTDLTTSGGSISPDGSSGNQQFMTSRGSLNPDHVSENLQGQTSGESKSTELK